MANRNRIQNGPVVHVRINPECALSILDWAAQMGYENNSFAQLVSFYIKSSREVFLKKGMLPEVDGFQYIERMQPYYRDQLSLRDRIETWEAGLSISLEEATQRLEELEEKRQSSMLDARETIEYKTLEQRVFAGNQNGQ